MVGVPFFLYFLPSLSFSPAKRLYVGASFRPGSPFIPHLGSRCLLPWPKCTCLCNKINDFRRGTWWPKGGPKGGFGCFLGLACVPSGVLFGPLWALFGSPRAPLGLRKGCMCPLCASKGPFCNLLLIQGPFGDHFASQRPPLDTILGANGS